MSLHDEFVQKYTKRLIRAGNVVGFEAAELYRPDIVIVDYNLRVIEYEIKMSELNLLNELAVIKQVLKDRSKTINFFEPGLWNNKQTIKRYKSQEYRRQNKYAKHAYYLKNDIQDHRKVYKPNQFYWVMPEYLYELHKKALYRLPYGVIVIRDKGKTIHRKRAQYLHDDKISTRFLWEIAYSTTKRLKEDNYYGI